MLLKIKNKNILCTGQTFKNFFEEQKIFFKEKFDCIEALCHEYCNSIILVV